MLKSTIKYDHNFYGKINILSVKSMSFAKEVAKEMISRNFLGVIVFYSTFPNCALLILVGKLISRNFCSKCGGEKKFHNFQSVLNSRNILQPQCVQFWNIENYTPLTEINI